MDCPKERRASVLSDDDIERIRFTCYGNMTQEEHAEQHNIFKDYLNREQVKAAKHARLKTQAFGALMVGMAGGIPSALYWFGSYIKEHLK